MQGEKLSGLLQNRAYDFEEDPLLYSCYHHSLRGMEESTPKLSRGRGLRLEAWHLPDPLQYLDPGKE